MKERINSFFISLHSWQLIGFAMFGAVVITDLIVGVFSLWFWNRIRYDLIILGTFIALLVPVVVMPVVIRMVRRMVDLEEQSKVQHERMGILEDQKNNELAAQRYQNESLQYELQKDRVLLETIQKQAQELTLAGNILSALEKSTLVLMKKLDLNDVLQTILAQAAQLLKTPHAFIYLVEPDEEVIKVTSGMGLFTKTMGSTLRPNQGLSGKVWQSGEPLNLNDYHKWEGRSTQFDAFQIHAVVGVPLKSDDHVVGVLGLAHMESDISFGPGDIDLISRFADLASIAFENANLYTSSQMELDARRQLGQAVRKRESILEAITFSAEQFLRSSNWLENINTVLERLGMEFNASHAYLFERHESAEKILVNSMRYEWTAPGQKPDINNLQYQNVPSESFNQKRYYETLDRGEPFIGSTSYFTEGELKDNEVKGIKALLEMRIVVDGEPWGTIGFDDMVNQREWTAVEVDVIRIAANVLGAAIKRQRDEEALRYELDQRKELIDELELKNKELNDFTYTVSHDLKSPLVTINGFLGYLDKDIQAGKTDRTGNDIQRIQNAVQKMEQLLNELLELSRIGRIMNTPQAVSFAVLVREALEIVHGRLEARKVTVRILAEKSLSTVYGDKPRLVEALQNLLDNAAKYMGSQTNPIIEIGSETSGDGETLFFVRDNGMGIAPEYHERVFGLFNKLDANSEGTGIGLALVKKIIEVHGGRIWVKSEPAKGSTFYFTLK